MKKEININFEPLYDLGDCFFVISHYTIIAYVVVGISINCEFGDNAMVGIPCRKVNDNCRINDIIYFLVSNEKHTRRIRESELESLIRFSTKEDVLHYYEHMIENTTL